jgi:hypothetical protein
MLQGFLKKEKRNGKVKKSRHGYCNRKISGNFGKRRKKRVKREKS